MFKQQILGILSLDMTNVRFLRKCHCYDTYSNVTFFRIELWYQMKAMPLISDHVAASCYSCATKFTAFRRRHHCRVCGQIFCHACCSIFVDGASLGKQSEIRTRTNLEHFCMMIPLQGEHDCGFALIATTTIRRNAASRGASEAEEPALALSNLPVLVSLRNLPSIFFNIRNRYKDG